MLRQAETTTGPPIGGGHAEPWGPPSHTTPALASARCEAGAHRSCPGLPGGPAWQLSKAPPLHLQQSRPQKRRGHGTARTSKEKKASSVTRLPEGKDEDGVSSLRLC